MQACAPSARTLSISPLRTSASRLRASSRPGMSRIVAHGRRPCHPARRAGIRASNDRGVDALRFRQLRVRRHRPLDRLSRLLRERRGRQRPRGRGDFWWGAAVSTAMVIGALTSPPLGGVADHAGTRKPFFVGFSVACIVVTALMATVGHGMAAWGWTLAVVGVVTYEAAIVPYNSYLPRIAPPERLGRVSAAGFAVGYAGSLVAFLAAYPFAAAHAYWGCFLAAAVLFALTSLPSFVVLPADTRHPMPLGVAAARGARATLTTLREILTAPERAQMRRFLMSYLIYEDGVNTV